MFFDAQQAQWATQETHPEPQPDPVRDLLKLGAGFVLGRSIAKVLQKNQWPAR